jgi:outer membrane lipoprotein LolB
MWRYRPASLPVFLMLAIGLSSCAVFERAPETVQDAEARLQLAAIERWRLDGRVGVRKSDESWQAGLIWNHEKDVDRLYISGPFGQGALNIKVKDNYIRVVSADGTVEESENPEQLLESWIGIAVPVSALRYWLLGLAYPATASDSEYDRFGHLVRLNQLGWITQYQDYQSVREWSVPRKLSVVNESTKVRLVIDDWHFPDAGSGDDQSF